MKTNENIKGSALPLVLGIIALAAIGYGGWTYLKKAQGPVDVTAPLTPKDSSVPPQLQSSEMPDQNRPDMNPSVTETVPPTTTPPEASTAVPATSEATAPVTGTVKIDVEKAMAPRIIGSATAPIKIIEYASLTCSHCAHFQNDVLPDLKSKYIDTGKVSLEYRDFPLNDPALKATLAARCLPEDKFEGFLNLLFKTQEHWAGGIDYMVALKQNAKLAGMSDETFEACEADPKLKLAVADGMQKAQDKWKISATPTFIVNDGAEQISGAQPLEEFERVFRKVSNNAIGDAPKVPDATAPKAEDAPKAE